VSTRVTSVASVGNDRRDRTECQYCGKWHSGSCRFHDKCEAADHFIKNCPRLSEQNVNQSGKPGATTARGRPSKNVGNASGGQRGSRDVTTRSEAPAPARAYAIRAREDASSPDVITDTFTLLDTNVIALIDPGSTHSYICETLASSKTLPVESTEFVIRVSNSLGHYVLVDKVCKKCPPGNSSGKISEYSQTTGTDSSFFPDSFYQVRTQDTLHTPYSHIFELTSRILLLAIHSRQ